MSSRLDNYLRTYRKRAGFSQDEVAFLLGSASGAKVSRYERLARRPSLRAIIAYEIIFQAPVRELFAGLYQKVEKATLARAQSLTKKLAAAKGDRMTPRKLATLRSLSFGTDAKSSDSS